MDRHGNLRWNRLGQYSGAVRATELAAVDLVSFIGEFATAQATRVLEVGCGRGELAAALIGAGYDVDAVDQSLEAVEASRARGVMAQQVDFLRYEGGPFDLVVFSRTLHELSDVKRGLRQAERVLSAGGLVIVDEFGRDWADRPTAGFFYDVCYLLGATGVLSPPMGPEDEDPLVRWQAEWSHARPNPRPGAQEISEMVQERFDLLRVDRCAYLYRHIGQWVREDSEGESVVCRLREVELRRLARADIQPMGMRLVGRTRRRNGVG